jgi:hypothetical protein
MAAPPDGRTGGAAGDRHRLELASAAAGEGLGHDSDFAGFPKVSNIK